MDKQTEILEYARMDLIESQPKNIGPNTPICSLQYADWSQSLNQI